MTGTYFSKVHMYHTIKGLFLFTCHVTLKYSFKGGFGDLISEPVTVKYNFKDLPTTCKKGEM